MGGGEKFLLTSSPVHTAGGPTACLDSCRPTTVTASFSLWSLFLKKKRVLVKFSDLYCGRQYKMSLRLVNCGDLFCLFLLFQNLYAGKYMGLRMYEYVFMYIYLFVIC